MSGKAPIIANRCTTILAPLYWHQNMHHILIWYAGASREGWLAAQTTTRIREAAAQSEAGQAATKILEHCL
jgi:hypothetical protein